MRYLYTLLFYLMLPFIFLRLIWRSRKAPAYRQRLWERLGFGSVRSNHSIWIHCVSLGETIAATPLIKALKSLYPQHDIIITNMTPTGSARVKSTFGDSVLNCYIPYDVPDAIQRFIKRINPQILVVMETELWPNLFAACKQHHIPVFVMNARLSEKSARGYRKIKSITTEIFSAVSGLAVQAHADAERFVEIGMPRERMKITGNMKFDLELPGDLPAKSIALREQLGANRLVWIAASTHPGEDEMMLTAHKIISQQFPNALLILVPRHPERFDAVAEQITQHHFNLQRRSANAACDAATHVFLGDSMGEMLLMYAVSDVACVAGSFVPVGGHNVLEPAALHKPVVTGSYLFNFAEISEMMLQANAMTKVETAEQLAEKIMMLFADKTLRDQMGENAFQVVEKNRGALQRQIDLIHNTGW